MPILLIRFTRCYHAQIMLLSPVVPKRSEIELASTLSSCLVYTFFSYFRYMCTLYDKDASTHLMRNFCVPRGRVSKSQLQTNKLKPTNKRNYVKHFIFWILITVSRHHALFQCQWIDTIQRIISFFLSFIFLTSF